MLDWMRSLSCFSNNKKVFHFRFISVYDYSEEETLVLEAIFVTIAIIICC